jgi:hypothetical protein
MGFLVYLSSIPLPAIHSNFVITAFFNILYKLALTMIKILTVLFLGMDTIMGTKGLGASGPRGPEPQI